MNGSHVSLSGRRHEKPVGGLLGSWRPKLFWMVEALVAAILSQDTLEWRLADLG